MSPRVQESWERKLATYVVAGGAVLAAAEKAQAAPIYSGLQNVAIGLDQTVDLDLDGDLTVDYQFINSFIPGVPNERRLDLLALGTNRTVSFAGFLADRLGPGVPLPGTEKFDDGPQRMHSVFDDSTDFGLWLGASNGYLGLEFDISGQIHYGWARLSVSGSTDVNDALTGTIHDWAYEDVAGRSIRTGQTSVPEPASLSLLALGAAGLAAYRRRRQGRTRNEIEA